MANSPARTPIRVARSLGRETLDQALEHRRRARQAAAAARQPLDRVNDQSEHARKLVRIADTKLLEFDRAEAQATGQTWPPQSPSTKQHEQRRVLAEDLSAAERTLRMVEAKAEVAHGPAELAVVAVAEIEKELEPAICAVLIEEGNAALARLTDARRRAVEAEAAVRSIAAAMVSRGWLQAAEKINTTLFTMRRPEGSVNTAPYLRFIERLKSDPDATVEA
jgi:hypothetical protein